MTSILKAPAIEHACEESGLDVNNLKSAHNGDKLRFDDTMIHMLEPDDQINVFIELAKLKSQLEKEAKIVSAMMTELNDTIVEFFAGLGQSKVSRRGMTVYIKEDIFPRTLSDDLVGALGPDPSKAELTHANNIAKDRVLQALAGDPETEHLVKEAYNAKSLQSWIKKDCVVDEETGLPLMPLHLEKVLGVSRVYKASTRKV